MLHIRLLLLRLLLGVGYLVLCRILHHLVLIFVILSFLRVFLILFQVLASVWLHFVLFWWFLLGFSCGLGRLLCSWIRSKWWVVWILVLLVKAQCLFLLLFATLAAPVELFSFHSCALQLTSFKQRTNGIQSTRRLKWVNSEFNKNYNHNLSEWLRF